MLPGRILQGIVNILEAILEAGLGEYTRLFEASSCEIFGKGRDSCNEESAMHPQTPYGKAKLLAHLAVKHYRCHSSLICPNKDSMTLQEDLSL